MPTVAHTAAGQQAANTLKSLDYLPANRNLLSWPIARHERAKVDWRIDEEEGWRGYAIGPGCGLFLPLNCGIERHATGFDVLVLLTLTGLAIARGPAELHLSNAAILRHMGKSPRSGKDKARLAAALKLWSHAELIFGRWYRPDKRKPRCGKYSTLTIDRPVREVGRGYVRLSRRWVALADKHAKFFSQIPTPLPTDAPTQNLILLILRTRDYEQLAGGWGRTRFRSRRHLTRCIGLEDRWNRNEQLNVALRETRDWFKRQGGEVYHTELKSNPNVRFFKYRLPAVEVPERVARRRIARNRARVRRKGAMAS